MPALRIPSAVASLVRGLHPRLKRKIRAGLDDIVADAHITKADRIWWAVGLKISSGCCKQESYGRISRGTHCLGFTARDLSRAAGCETECGR